MIVTGQVCLKRLNNLREICGQCVHYMLLHMRLL